MAESLGLEETEYAPQEDDEIECVATRDYMHNIFMIHKFYQLHTLLPPLPTFS